MESYPDWARETEDEEDSCCVDELIHLHVCFREAKRFLPLFRSTDKK
jgi:hypothetical protein